ncbi:MAG: hypothetical protein J5562_02855 [Clostridia bacterium]|jgi:hypothetical protein|nr:hypothetical protein [Clostridia bacterium]
MTQKEYLFYNSKGLPCKEDDAALCVIREKDEKGNIINETEIEITQQDDFD